MNEMTWREKIRHLFTIASWKIFLFFSGLTAEEYWDEVWKTEKANREWSEGN